jgi:hypothetical protein
MSQPPHDHNNEKYPEYCYPSPKFVYSEQRKIIELVKAVCLRLKWDFNDVHINKKLYEAIHRVDQSKLHYKIYRKGMVIGELKEAALLCYWIIRYRPIRFKTEGRDEINEVIAFYILKEAANKSYKDKFKKGDKDFSFIIEDVLYNFMHRSVTYDSMILLAKTMAI